MLFAQATKWLEQRKRGKEPFFCWLATNAPHGPYIAKPEDKAIYEGKNLGVDTENFVAQVATDNYRGGQTGAERIGKILNGKGKVAIVAVMPGAASTMLREQGFEETIHKSYPGIEIVEKRYGMADFAK